jgi:DNA-cytosine methyltransferase
MSQLQKVRVFDVFAGYGGAEFALKKAGIEHTCIGFSEIDKYAIQCFEQNHKGVKNYGDCTKIDPNDLPDFDLLTGGFPCCLAGTLITTQRGHIPIEEVVVGDFVLTHKNRWRKVINTMNHFRDHHYVLKIQGAYELKFTGNHCFYGRKMMHIWGTQKRKSERHWSDVEWISVEDMRKDDFFAIGTWGEKYSSNPKNLTTDDCWLLGRYVADGYIQNGLRKNRTNSYNHKITFCVGKDKQKTFLNKVSDSKYWVGTSEERTVFKNRIINKTFMGWCLDCGKGASNKKVPFWVMNLPTTKLKCFLDGYVSGDGSFSNGWYGVTTVSKVLAYQIGQIVNRIYKIPYIISFSKKPTTTKIEGCVVNQKDLWCVKWKLTKGVQDNAKRIGNNTWVRYNSKEKIMGSVKTYNLTVDEDHSYVANNIIVKNCVDVSIAGKRDLSKGRTNLYTEVLRIAKAKKPKYMLLENVKGLLSINKERNLRDIIINDLNKIGYDVCFKCLNSKDYGIPQNRERVWFVCKLGKWQFGEFMFPIPTDKNKLTLKDILLKEVEDKYYLTEKQIKHLQRNFGAKGKPLDLHKPSQILSTAMGTGGGNVPFITTKSPRECEWHKESPARCARDYKDPKILLINPFNGKNSTEESGTIGTSVGSTTGKTAQILIERQIKFKEKSLRIYDDDCRCLCDSDSVSTIPILTDAKTLNSNKENCHTIRAGQGSGNKIYVNNFRKLTPRECFRLMGFVNDEINLEGLSDTQCFKLAGNGWEINVVSKIFKHMFKDGFKK